MLKRRSSDVRLVECPFCEADLEDVAPAEHLVRCREFYEAFDEERPAEFASDDSSAGTGQGGRRPDADLQAAMDRAQRSGTWVGRAPAGFQVVDGDLRVDSREFRALSDAFSRVEAGETSSSVSRDIDVVHSSTFRRLWADDDRRQIYTEYSSENKQIQAALDEWLGGREGL